MAKLLKIGIVGCGAIGSSLAKAITQDMSAQAHLVGLYDSDTLKAKRLSRLISKNKDLVVNNLGQLINKSQLIIESASSKSAWEIAQNTLIKGRDIMIMSLGGVVGRFEQLRRLAKKHNSKVFIPSGAISGIDALKASRMGKIKRVVLTTYKNPLSFKGVEYIKKKRIDLDRIDKDKILFFGTAKAAVRYFPQNINVAGVLSIAGIGQNRTKVKIIASPSIKKNVHEIIIESSAGKVITRTENILHPHNPKTSYLAVLSAIATLRQIFEPVRIGT